MSNTQIILTIISLMISALGAVFAAAAYVRTGRWRDTDEGKAVQTDIHDIKNELTKINARLSRAERVDEELPSLVDRVTRIETTLNSVATSGDFRELKAEVEGLESVVRNTHAATQRIEGWLMEDRSK